MWHSIVNFGAGIYLLILSVVFLIVIQNGSATIHLDSGTPYDLLLTFVFGSSSILFLIMGIKEIGKKS